MTTSKRKDFTQTAFDVVQRATGAAPKPVESAKQIAGRAGGLKGGKARMDALSGAQRTALALKGVAAKKTPASSGAGVGKVTKAGG